MPVDPNLVPLLQLIDNAPAMPDGTPEQAREAFRTLMVTMRDPAQVVPVADVGDATIAGRPVRVYRPEGTGPRPTIVFFHGGGFVIGDLDTHDSACRRFAAGAGAVVVAVDYRLAPEHHFPAAVDDCWAVLRAVAAEIDAYGGDAARLAVAGDSAGGNLSAVCAQQARDEGLPLALQVLIYPSVDLLGDWPSRLENATGKFLTLADMVWFGQNYVGLAPDDPRALEVAADPRLSPLQGRVDGVAPAIVVTGEFDPLRDEGNAYAEALRRAGVDVVHRQFDGLIHGFLGLEQFSPTVAAATAWIVEQTAARLAG